MVSLLLGPVLRHVDETTAVVWVQTDAAARVEVLGCAADTFEIAGHHFALVVVTGLLPDTRTPYQVYVDGSRLWPPPASPFPGSVIPTRGPASAGRHRIVFGSCRYVKMSDPEDAARYGLDALDAYAARMARRPVAEWPDALLLLGDQVYADELTPQTRRRIADRRDMHPEWPPDEIVDFAEYVGLYRDSWANPEIRWIMSTVPTAMIFDDHDVRDDWNTSARWRQEMARVPWWRHRIRAALASYWVYQHLGNLSPGELAADPDYRKITGRGGDVWPVLAGLGDRADAEVDGSKGVRFSFRWDLGRSRLVMIDSRNGRILEGGRRMLGDGEFGWVEDQALAPGEVDHLILGTSVPWLLPPAISDLETLNEAAADRPGWRGRLAERIRQRADLEHWPAFRTSFDRLTRLVEDVSAGRGGAPRPATVSVLSGDVHHSYAARAHLAHSGHAGNTAVHQLTCSPVHNRVPRVLEAGFQLGWAPATTRLTRRMARRAGIPAPGVRWERRGGPLFGNTIATLLVDGRRAEVLFEQPHSAASLHTVARHELSAG
ncbi:alkaline phosphatase D family protein [Pseudonocardia asaccharolytica]|uniref:Alkaline phosphatase n=1 Tax=Pseudonocardia asaccharolytica DSM 44247 = NBRC 16224 TaxID=1123024 RepID=A0A511CYU2_9PSEU|nr:alkaline phosphatase D family protein [Pseudonocardia asaccharolytica]GEL17729.1 alkaline phosphatase [Pseudonocardia asaccharolytica DSM 44247 = NBRC 16224]